MSEEKHDHSGQWVAGLPPKLESQETYYSDSLPAEYQIHLNASESLSLINWTLPALNNPSGYSELRLEEEKKGNEGLYEQRLNRIAHALRVKNTDVVCLQGAPRERYPGFEIFQREINAAGYQIAMQDDLWILVKAPCVLHFSPATKPPLPSRKYSLKGIPRKQTARDFLLCCDVIKNNVRVRINNIDAAQTGDVASLESYLNKIHTSHSRGICVTAGDFKYAVANPNGQIFLNHLQPANPQLTGGALNNIGKTAYRATGGCFVSSAGGFPKAVYGALFDPKNPHDVLQATGKYEEQDGICRYIPVIYPRDKILNGCRAAGLDVTLCHDVHKNKFVWVIPAHSLNEVQNEYLSLLNPALSTYVLYPIDQLEYYVLPTSAQLKAFLEFSEKNRSREHLLEDGPQQIKQMQYRKLILIASGLLVLLLMIAMAVFIIFSNGFENAFVRSMFGGMLGLAGIALIVGLVDVFWWTVNSKRNAICTLVAIVITAPSVGLLEYKFGLFNPLLANFFIKVKFLADGVLGAGPIGLIIGMAIGLFVVATLFFIDRAARNRTRIVYEAYGLDAVENALQALEKNPAYVAHPASSYSQWLRPEQLGHGALPASVSDHDVIDDGQAPTQARESNIKTELEKQQLLSGVIREMEESTSTKKSKMDSCFAMRLA